MSLNRSIGIVGQGFVGVALKEGFSKFSIETYDKFKDSTCNNIQELCTKVKIIFVKDRPGHDFRYALDSNKIRRKLKWKSKINLNVGLAHTFKWYLNNMKFFTSVARELYDKRLGLK